MDFQAIRANLRRRSVMDPHVKESIRSYLKERVAHANLNKATAEYRAASAALKNAKKTKIRSNIRKARHRHTVAFRWFVNANQKQANAANAHYYNLHALAAPPRPRYFINEIGNLNVNYQNNNRIQKAHTKRMAVLSQLARKMQRWALRAKFHPSRATARRLMNEAASLER